MKIEYTPPGNTEPNRPDLLPVGWHSFEVLACYDSNRDGEKLLTKDGDPYLKVRVEESSTGTVLYHTLFFSDKGSAKINSFLYATGIAGSNELELSISPEDFEGKRFRGLVGSETWNGKQFNRIELVKPFEQSEENEQSKEDEVPF